MISLKAGGWNTCALSESGKVYAWGNANNGDQSHVPKNMGTVRQIEAAAYSAAAVNSENKVFRWGIFGGIEPFLPPAAEAEISAVAATEYDFAFLGAEGKVHGDMKHRQAHKKFKPKPEMSDIKLLAGGYYNFAALDKEGKVHIWGEYDETAEGSGAVVNVPSNLPRIIEVAVGAYDILCLGVDGKIYAWGNFGTVIPPVFDGFANEPLVFETVPAIAANECRDVRTFEEFCEAVQNRTKNITIKKNMEITGESVYIINGITITVDKDVTLTVKSPNFFVHEKLINNGTISGTKTDAANGWWPHGSLVVCDDIGGTGSIDKSSLLDISRTGSFDADEIGKYLAEDSIYTQVRCINDSQNAVVIGKDLLIPENKTLWLNNSCTLQIDEGATLTVKGKLTLFKNPIINGAIVGEITNLDPSSGEGDVCSFEKLCEATHQNPIPGKSYVNLPKVTIKADMSAEVDFRLERFTSLIVDAGVTLTVNCDNFVVMGEFTNNGTICGTGHIYVDSQIGGTGGVNIDGGLKLSVYDADAGDLGKILAEDSIYSEVIYTNSGQLHYKSIFDAKPDGEKTFVEIENDLLIPENKSVWININGILKVKKGATLTIEGRLQTFSEPAIEGLVIGKIDILEKFPFA